MAKSMLIALLLVPASARTTWRELEGYTFVDYVNEFGRDYAPDEWRTREAPVESRLAVIRAHNHNPTVTWHMGVNELTDRTDAEISATKKGRDARHADASAPRAAARRVDSALLPESLDWRERGVVTAVKDQGSCGSCWSFAGTEVLESHAALATGSLFTFAPQQWVDCAPNPDDCGGTGGCEGSIAELVFETARGGIVNESSLPYTARDAACDSAGFEYVAKVDGHVLLVRNSYEPVIEALARRRPKPKPRPSRPRQARGRAAPRPCRRRSPSARRPPLSCSVPCIVRLPESMTRSFAGQPSTTFIGRPRGSTVSWIDQNGRPPIPQAEPISQTLI